MTYFGLVQLLNFSSLHVLCNRFLLIIFSKSIQCAWQGLHRRALTSACTHGIWCYALRLFIMPWNEWLLSCDCSCRVDDHPATTLTWTRISTSRVRRFDGHADAGLPPPGPHEYSAAWNSMVHPLLNMTIKGVAWYQGMHLMRRFMNSLLWLPSVRDPWKQADVWT